MTDQRVIAIYFDKDRRVQRLADYGMKDGKIFDFVSRTDADRRQGAELPQLFFMIAVTRVLTVRSIALNRSATKSPA